MQALGDIYKRIVEVKGLRAGSLKLNGVQDLYSLVRSCTSNEIVHATSFTKLLVVASSVFDVHLQEVDMKLPIAIYLHGPDPVGNEIVLSRHPHLRATGGTLVDAVEPKPVIVRNEKGILRARERYHEIAIELDRIDRVLSILSLRDQILVAHNMVFNRSEFSDSTNILTCSEAIDKVVWQTLCRNLSRMTDMTRHLSLKVVDGINPKGTVQIDISGLNDAGAPVECLKHGSINDLCTFEAIYVLNANGIASGTPRKMNENLYRLLSPYYLNALRDYNYHLHRSRLSHRDVERLMRKKQEPSDLGEKELCEHLRGVRKNRNTTKGVVDESIDRLLSECAIELRSSNYVCRGNVVEVTDRQGVHYVELPSKEELDSLRIDIAGFLTHVKRMSLKVS